MLRGSAKSLDRVLTLQLLLTHRILVREQAKDSLVRVPASEVVLHLPDSPREADCAHKSTSVAALLDPEDRILEEGVDDGVSLNNFEPLRVAGIHVEIRQLYLGA